MPASPKRPSPGTARTSPAASIPATRARCEQIVEERHPRYRLTVLPFREIEMHGEDVVGRAAQVIGLQPHVALQQQAGADEQNHRERNFGAHKDFPHTGTRTPPRRTAR